MPDPDEMRELLVNARDAIYDLLAAAPGEFVGLRREYVLLRDVIVSYDRQRSACPTPTFAEQLNQGNAERQAEAEAWKRTPKAEKHHWILNALGDDRLSIRDLTDRLEAHNGAARFGGRIEALVKELLAAGEIEREPTGGRGSQPRWRYHRRVALSPEILALEEALSEGDDEAVA